ncbi:MAG: radical SAM protein [Promethearchaeati archaeon SRVP18_Atabeyarchaeia-1]
MFKATSLDLRGGVIHDFMYGLNSRKCPHMGLINLTPPGQCVHLCAYCYARGYKWSVHPEKTGEVVYYRNVAEKLERELSSMTLCPPLYLCATTDVFQPIDEVTQSALETVKTIIRFGVSFHIVTKSSLVRKILEVPGFDKYPYFFLEVSLDTINDEKRQILSPNSSPIEDRIETLRLFASKGFYTVARMDPIVFGFTDEPDELHHLLETAMRVGAKHIISSTTRFDAVGMKELKDRLTMAGMEKAADRVKKNYANEGRWLRVPRRKREEFHRTLRTEAERLGLTYAVCMELDKSYDSTSILHCEGSPNSYMMMRSSEGAFEPICNADCIRSCPNPKEPPCGAPELALQYPFSLKTLQKRAASSTQLRLSTT